MSNTYNDEEEDGEEGLSIKIIQRKENIWGMGYVWVHCGHTCKHEAFLYP